jgi:hypothetical protein
MCTVVVPKRRHHLHIPSEMVYLDPEVRHGRGAGGDRSAGAHHSPPRHPGQGSRLHLKFISYCHVSFVKIELKTE